MGLGSWFTITPDRPTTKDAIRHGARTTKAKAVAKAGGKWGSKGGAVCGICKGPIAAGKGKANAHTRCAKNWRPTK